MLNVNEIRVIDDYAHHPAEIMAVVDSAKQTCKGKIYMVMQPHRYSRLKTFFEEFARCYAEVEKVLICDVYAAGEEENGFSGELLSQAVNKHSNNAIYATDFNKVDEYLTSSVMPGDLVVFVGAGNITSWAHALGESWKTNPPANYFYRAAKA